MDDAVKDLSRMGLTPPHRFRQAEPSKCLRGQTTSLSTSEAEKELVKEDFGGIERGLMHGAARSGRELCTNTHSLDTAPEGQPSSSAEYRWKTQVSTQWLSKGSIEGEFNPPPAEVFEMWVEAPVHY
ncbi:MAG: hypothetical protein Q9210_001646 [Variospora velana]